MATLSTDKVEALQREILEELTDDYMGLWEVADLVAAELETTSASEIRESTLRLVETMLRGELIRPGLARNDGSFEAWGLEDPTGAAAEIARQWDELGRRPTLGDIAWFNLTDYGEKVALS